MLRAMIVDDEPLARSELRFLLEDSGRVGTIVEAASAREAVEKLMEGRVDVIFLDISMPKTSGMQLAEALNKLRYPPAVVFVTAYSEFALEAFNVDAVDYLVKPVETDRLEQALNKMQARGGARTTTAVATTAQKQTPRASQERIPVVKSGRKVLVPVDQIRFIESKDDYSCIYTGDERFLSTISLTKFEGRLETLGFFRVHRAFLINLAYAKGVEVISSGVAHVIIEGFENKQIAVSRRRVLQLKQLLGEESHG